MENRKIPDLCKSKETCCGCGICTYVCQLKAITMVRDYKGFLYPQIDEFKCVGCFKCLNICSFKKKQNIGENLYE